MSRVRLLFSCILLLVSFQFANASIDVYEFTTEERRTEYNALTKELRCPKCQNQDIADSNAPIASDMRREVHRLLEEGKTHDQVIQFMVERFGDFVTYKPKVSVETYALWYGPWVFVVFGLFIIAIVVRRKKNDRQSDASPEEEMPDSKESNKQIQALLKEYDSNKEQDKR